MLSSFEVSSSLGVKSGPALLPPLDSSLSEKSSSDMTSHIFLWFWVSLRHRRRLGGAGVESVVDRPEVEPGVQLTFGLFRSRVFPFDGVSDCLSSTLFIQYRQLVQVNLEGSNFVPRNNVVFQNSQFCVTCLFKMSSEHVSERVFNSVKMSPRSAV